MEQKRRKIFHNPVSLIGLITVVFNLGLLVLLSTVNALDGPYAGFVIWLVLPWLVFLGLILIGLGFRPPTGQEAGRQGSLTNTPDQNDRQL
jgi:cytochrome c biogenesis protein CcdA